MLQWKHLEPEEQAGACRARMGQMPWGEEPQLVGSSGEPQVSGFSLILHNMYPLGGRVAVAGVYMARGKVIGRFQSMYFASSSGGGASLTTYIEDKPRG